MDGFRSGICIVVKPPSISFCGDSGLTVSLGSALLSASADPPTEYMTDMSAPMAETQPRLPRSGSWVQNEWSDVLMVY